VSLGAISTGFSQRHFDGIKAKFGNNCSFDALVLFTEVFICNTLMACW